MKIMKNKLLLIQNCNTLLQAFKSGELGQTIMPEDSHPHFTSKEERLAYFTLPMALNYQRDSYKLWESALKTYNDPETKFVFDIEQVSKKSEDEVRIALMKYKVALQPNKHVNSWWVISKTIYENWGSIENLFEANQNDFLKLKEIIKVEYKKGFPYLSGPKIFNYWSFIMSTYGGIKLKNRDHIEIAPDTHITQCSVKLGVITSEEAINLTKDAISEKWRSLLVDSGIDPIDMHSPLWFWSRNGFLFELK
jgi:hypothetical protein